MSFFLKHILATFLMVGFMLLGSANTAFACTCYEDGGLSSSLDGTAECVTACGEGGATEEDGVCDCPESNTSATITCETTCAAAGYSHEPPTVTDTKDYVEPNLNVDIPGFSFTDVISKKGNLEISWLGDYVSSVYQYLVGIGAFLAIIMVMIGGLQYTFAAGGGDTAKAKKRINNAIIGFSLLLSVFMILFLVNPNLVFFDALKLLEVNEIKLDLAASGDEGVPSNISRSTCDAIVATAKDDGTCDISQTVISPTGGQPNCGNHHWFDDGANGDYKKINNLDFAAGWGLEIKAPISGTLTYEKQTDDKNRCGNRVTITGTGDAAGASLVICHMKDFINDSGKVLDGVTVEQGATIGHIGGNCCDDQNPPANWYSAKYGWCNVGGTACTDPYAAQSCSCQDYQQAGNTSGPHVHMTWERGGDLLTCLDY